MRLATIDIGTNSTRLLISESDERGKIKQLLKLGRVTRLGKGVKKTGRLSKESIEKTIVALKEFKQVIEQYKVDKVIVATTEAARLAENADEFLNRVRELGFEIEILSDKEEAELVFKANVLSFNVHGRAMTVDLGGGSTEIVYGTPNKIEYLESLKFGVVTLYEEFLKSDPPTEEELSQLESFIREKLLEVKKYIKEPDFEVFAVGGTITSVVAMEEEMEVYKPEIVHGYRVTKAMVEKWYKKLISLTESERKKVKGLEENRSDVIIPGLAFFKVFCEVFNKESLTVSEHGLLYGLALKEVEKCLKKE
ncbi:exopolyphosphatase / guanosine-5'-triphosphate,3'-diphosphate pyrophosphatase [Desulfurobacterium pacificum]|uniref:Exopolyphosphatase / guanosine-5'-triphosphate,3'-diphosphate pyrophosphatase n=1 Tax=Desulfurobacterium pacificum TaxID=240166 RepID=A0ABY1NS69_9BACT|nr:Ppx/GppA phosphatase family protein [Desulfurobacterium pacificum]SMP16966.1 exopolyphosphatase / guanosine-5'-triphosphate,3'-diphosphate pyrophosphatase [Desulfurobacterium pacificum]